MNQRTWVEVSASLFNSNVKNIKQLIGNQKIALSIKSNAYGHGLAAIGQLAEENPDILFLCTAHSDEALFLRSIGIKKPILNMVYGDVNDLFECIRQRITLSVTDQAQALRIMEIAEAVNQVVSVHIKVDTGLHRLGCFATEVEDIVKQLEHPLIKLEGIFTHISDKDNRDQEYTQQQLMIFNEAIACLARKKIVFSLVHALSSGVIEFSTQCHYSMVRPGTNIYGLWSSSISQQRINDQLPDFTLQPVLTWKTRIVQVKTVEIGTCVGYARTYTTTRPTTIAILPIGYWDGYFRGFSNKACVAIKNKLVPVLGIVSMNLVAVDVTDIPCAQVGDEVVLLGNIPGITATDLALLIGTINIEVTTRINPTIPRIIVP